MDVNETTLDEYQDAPVNWTEVKPILDEHRDALMKELIEQRNALARFASAVWDSALEGYDVDNVEATELLEKFGLIAPRAATEEDVARLGNPRMEPGDTLYAPTRMFLDAIKAASATVVQVAQLSMEQRERETGL